MIPKKDADITTSGILLIDKPGGMTSHDCVSLLRRKMGYDKVGHAGTLDPMATGLLVMLVGKATKLSNSFLNDDKAYSACLRLGITTDTLDAEGAVTAVCDTIPDEKAVRDAVGAFKGEIMQMPPMYSAKKRDGKKLYEYARKGIEVERVPVKVFIKEINIVRCGPPDVCIDIICSKGTYVRQLADDIGKKLGCGAHLTMLRRTSSGRFNIRDAVTVEEIKNMTVPFVNARLLAV